MNPAINASRARSVAALQSPNMDGHFIDQSRRSADIRSIETAPRAKPRYENRSPANSGRHACAHDVALFLRGNRRLLLSLTVS
jgi:hypothetical protein